MKSLGIETTVVASVVQAWYTHLEPAGGFAVVGAMTDPATAALRSAAVSNAMQAGLMSRGGVHLMCI